jgi:hypothetical protein
LQIAATSYTLMASPLNTLLPSKRKRFLNPKLMTEDNVHEDAVKRRKAAETSSETEKMAATKTQPTTRTSVDTQGAKKKTASSPVVESDTDTEIELLGGSNSDKESDSEPIIFELEGTEPLDTEEASEEMDEQELGMCQILVPQCEAS